MAKYVEKPVPSACIEKFARHSYCERDIEMNEFVFKDAAYAVYHYANSKHIRACPACVAKFIAATPGFDMNIGPMATRGMKNDR